MGMTVRDNVASYASLHYGHELNQRYGDVSVANLTLDDFFYPRSKTLLAPRKTKLARWTPPTQTFSARRVDMDRLQDLYSEAPAQPTRHDGQHWVVMQTYAKRLHRLLEQQEKTEATYQALIQIAYPDSIDQQKRLSAWSSAHSPDHPECEVQGHMALVDTCKDKLDMTTSFAMQFHQVLVNLCSDELLGWGSNPRMAVAAARDVCTEGSSVAREIIV